MDAYDITQEVLIKIFKYLDRYNPNYKFTTWLYKITTRTALDYLRHKDKHQRIQTKVTHHSEPPNNLTAAIDHVLIKKEQDKALYDAIDKLPPKLKSVVILYYFENLPQKEIATILEIPLGTVHSRLSHCKKQLKTLLTREGAHHDE